ncbi:MAG TPA: hypothetical protein VGN82_13650 [Bosea sp. (in: a-proteobacteria)]|jgi:ribosomal protein S27E|uniref:hypothetical protein n=1 Tax=Bosea sp. (in: a-proteobacteria) TaxID=1871050 RepID=UPI002E0D6802|nr:hypothetical protein [Bosea sp. (in: a-proteobacteria)]
MASDTNSIRCDGCGDATIRMPEWTHDDSEIFCSGCGEPLGTIKSLRERVEAAVSDEPDTFADNDNQ